MILAECVFKIHDDKGNIIIYRLRDISGNVNEVKSVDLKRAIACNQIYIVNLILTKDNRLVDRSFKNELCSNKTVEHTPNNELSEELKYYIMVTGLVHFFHDKFLEDTEVHGLKTSYDGIRALKRKEKNHLWFYINKDDLETEANEYMSKESEHRPSNTKHLCKAVWHPNYEEVSKLRYRKAGKASKILFGLYYKAPAFVYNQDISANRLEISRCRY